MKVLITGVAGFIGSNLAAWLINQGHLIVGLDNFTAGYHSNVPEGIEVIEGTLQHENWQRQAKRWGPYDVVIHLAAFASEGLSPFVRKMVYENNVLGTANLLQWLIEREFQGKLIFTSSSAAHGSSVSAAPYPVDPYGISKLASEFDVDSAGALHGFETAIVRLSNVYGPRQSMWNPYRNVFGRWCRQALMGQPLTLVGGGKQTRPFTYIDDILEGLWRGERWVCSRQHVPLSHALQVFQDVTGYRGSVAGLAKRYELETVYANPSHQSCRTSLRDGLWKMWEWAQQEWTRYKGRKELRVPLEIQDGAPSEWC